jgi:hypothetical protein
LNQIDKGELIMKKLHKTILGMGLLVASTSFQASAAGISVGTNCEELNEAYDNNTSWVQKWGGNFAAYAAGTEVYCPIQRTSFASGTLAIGMSIYDYSSASETTCTAYSRDQSGSNYAYRTANTGVSATGVRYIGFSLPVGYKDNAYIYCNMAYANRIIQYNDL